jgi:hypothetical protein
LQSEGATENSQANASDVPEENPAADDHIEQDAASTGGNDAGVGGTEEVSVAGYNATGEEQGGNSGLDDQSMEDPPAVPEPTEPVIPEIQAEDVQMAEDPPPHRYPKRDRQPPSEWNRVNKARLHALEGLTDNPATCKEAMQRPDRDLWEQAIDDEMRALHEKRVYTEVSNPVGITPLPSKFVLTIKRDELGHVEK